MSSEGKGPSSGAGAAATPTEEEGPLHLIVKEEAFEIEEMEEDDQEAESNFENENMEVAGQLVVLKEAASDDGEGRPEDKYWRTLKEACYAMYMQEDGKKDVTFVVGPEREPISAHRQWLAIQSSGFNHILNLDSRVKDVKGHVDLVMPFFKPQAFRLMLKFMYTYEADDITTEDAVGVIKVAEWFGLTALKIICMTKVRTEINSDNAAKLLEEASQLNETRLREMILGQILPNAREVFNTEGFFSLSLDNLCSILENNHLRLKEISVFLACVRWAERKVTVQNPQTVDTKIPGEKIREALGPAVFLIRFPLISQCDFTFYVVPSNILTQEEIINVFCITSAAKKDGTAPTDIKPSIFSEVKRTFLEQSSVEATSSTQDANDEPQRKVRRLELPSCPTSVSSVSTSCHSPAAVCGESEKGGQSPSLVPVKVTTPSEKLTLETLPSTSGCQTPPPDSIQHIDDEEQVILEDPQTVDEVSDYEEEEDNDGSSSSTSGGAEPELRPVAVRRHTPKRKGPPPLLSEEEKDYYDKNNKDDGNNAHNFYQRLRLMAQEDSMDFVGEVREDLPVVLNCHSNFKFEPLEFPALQEYHVNYLASKPTVSSFKTFLKTLELNNLILYKCISNGNIYNGDIRDFWSAAINTTIAINGVILIKVDFKTMHSVVIGRTKQASELLDGLGFRTGWKEIHLSECDITSLTQIPYASLTKLTLQRVKGTKNWASFLWKCKHLQELSCSGLNDEALDLGVDLGLLSSEGTKLRRLALGKGKLICSTPIMPLQNQITELYLDACTLSPEMVEAFPQIFPKLKKFKICRHATPKLLFQLINGINSLEWIGIWELSLSHGKGKGRGRPKNTHTGSPAKNAQSIIINYLKDFLEKAGLEKPYLSHPDLKSFILEKKPISNSNIALAVTEPIASSSQASLAAGFVGVRTSESVNLIHEEMKWVATKLTKTEQYDVYTKLDYEQFGWTPFFDSYNTFVKMSE